MKLIKTKETPTKDTKKKMLPTSAVSKRAHVLAAFKIMTVLSLINQKLKTIQEKCENIVRTEARRVWLKEKMKNNDVSMLILDAGDVNCRCAMKNAYADLTDERRASIKALNEKLEAPIEYDSVSYAELNWDGIKKIPGIHKFLKEALLEYNKTPKEVKDFIKSDAINFIKEGTSYSYKDKEKPLQILNKLSGGDVKLAEEIIAVTCPSFTMSDYEFNGGIKQDTVTEIIKKFSPSISIFEKEEVL